MRLTRRDAVAAAVVGGVGIGLPAVSIAELRGGREEGDAVVDPSFTDGDLTTMHRLAEAIYPSEVTVTVGFIEGYADRLPESRRRATRECVRLLDDACRRDVGVEFASVSPPAKRRAVLCRLGVHAARSNPTGTVAERIRYHLVNSLLYALFTSPRGSTLVGFENPIGHPGGYESQTSAPEDDDD
ncbi:gluconate 2-dehydrogenase subunit 3 family protein [Natrialbaceae archaeon GCM10025810]|uniref:gluconate 2-dehydrogenase subunit 3 family protein n=1 Tax=Halovalidus salilacus TaxID=3075124 RepID=UPI003623FC0C